MKMRENNSRAVAADVIGLWLAGKEFPGRSLEEAQVSEMGGVMERVYGVVRWKRALEWVLGKLMRKIPRRGVRSFLLIGAHEILFMSDTKAYATVDELVELTKMECSRSEADFVNAVMRKLVVEKNSFIQALQRQPLAVRLSHPDDLVLRWQRQFGEKEAESLCLWNNTRPNLTIRVNRLKTGFSAYHKQLVAAGVGLADTRRAAEGWLALEHGVSVPELPGYKEGLFAVVDPATEMSVALLDPHPGDRVLDACAAPGGKTFLIAERMEKKGCLTAVESNPQRVPRLRENMRRLGYDGFVRIMRGDAGCLPAGNSFDMALLDVPCSNTGIIRKKPDVKWRFSERLLARLRETQLRILAGGFRVLSRGGHLVYSTCSLEEEENEAIVRSFLKSNHEARLVEERRLFPPCSGTDGAYAALLVRKQR